MTILVSSPDTVRPAAGPVNKLLPTLRQLAKGSDKVLVVSNHEKPSWFDEKLGVAGVAFAQRLGRQNGEFLQWLATDQKVEPHELLVLAGSRVDVAMAKNAGATLVGAGWAIEPSVTGLGIKVDQAADLPQVLALTGGWPGGWFFEAEAAGYSLRVLSDLSTMHKGIDQMKFGKIVAGVIKGGGSRLTALLVVVARSLASDGAYGWGRTLWGLYPSSKVGSTTKDTQVLSDFGHRLRTTVSSAQLCRRDSPLFVRHAPGYKRSARPSPSPDRTNPIYEFETLHLNPAYEASIKGKHVVVLDDCTTYGTSFAVAAALLTRAGAAKVTCVALGKFGNQTLDYEIEVTGNPFAPLTADDVVIGTRTSLSGPTDLKAQAVLRGVLL